MIVSQGQSVADAVRAIGVTEVTYYRWRQEFGGLKTDQVKRLKDLEAENARQPARSPVPSKFSRRSSAGAGKGPAVARIPFVCRSESTVAL